jgi:hypothetical protein
MRGVLRADLRPGFGERAHAQEVHSARLAEAGAWSARKPPLILLRRSWASLRRNSWRVGARVAGDATVAPMCRGRRMFGCAEIAG